MPDASHVHAVSQAPPPTDTLFPWAHIMVFKIHTDYSAVVESLRALNLGSASFTWTAEAQTSFEWVKDLIINSPALTLFDPELHTIVTTDASNYVLGFILTQMHPDGSEKTVAFASRTLTLAERKYSTIEEEMENLPVGATFYVKYRPQTTHNTAHFEGTRTSRTSDRWSARLMTFDYDIQNKPGHENVTADCLSRLPLQSRSPVL